MFTLDLKIAKELLAGSADSIIMFLVLVDSGRKLPVYFVTDSSLVEICSNIFDYRDSLVDVVSEEGFKYGALVGVSYVQ
jgi:hypothetical protein